MNEGGEPMVSDIPLQDYDVVRPGIMRTRGRFGMDHLNSSYPYRRSNPCYNYYRDLSFNPKKIGLAANEMGMYAQPCVPTSSELPTPMKPNIGVGQSAEATPRNLLPRTINFSDRLDADNFYTLCQLNRAFYKEIPVMRPWDYSYFVCGRPMFEPRSLTEVTKIRQEVPYKHPLVLPVTLCRTYPYNEGIGKHRYVPHISQSETLTYVS